MPYLKFVLSQYSISLHQFVLCCFFQLLDEKKLQETKNLYADFESPEKAANVYEDQLGHFLSWTFLSLDSLKLTHFEKFEDTTQALAAVTATVEGKISKPLKKLLKRLVDPDVQDKLLVADSALGKAIKVRLMILIWSIGRLWSSRRNSVWSVYAIVRFKILCELFVHKLIVFYKSMRKNWPQCVLDWLIGNPSFPLVD